LKNDLPKLSMVALPAGEVEVRFWIVPSFGKAKGVVLRNDGSATRALVIDASGTRTASVSRAAWEKVIELGVLTLPDESALASDGKYILDGVMYVVEVQRDGVYRTYSYGNPSDHEYREATQVLAIAHVLARELHVRIDDRSEAVRARVPDVDVTTSDAMGAPCDPLDMSQPGCGAHGRVSWARERNVRVPCDPKPIPPPNPYGWSACIDAGRVYFPGGHATTLVLDIAETSDEQRLYMQKRIGMAHATPLRTVDEWRAALMASSPAR